MSCHYYVMSFARFLILQVARLDTLVVNVCLRAHVIWNTCLGAVTMKMVHAIVILATKAISVTKVGID